MITVGIDAKKLRKALIDITSQMPTAIATGINSTAKKARNDASKVIRKELGSRVPLKAIKAAARAKAVASKDKLSAVMALEKGRPISLRYFNPLQNKAGVSVRLDRNIKGKQGKTFLPHAFKVKRLGGKVFLRAGKSRLPIKEQFGPSPGNFMEALGLEKSSVALIQTELPKRIRRKVRDLLYRTKAGNQ